LALSFAEDDRLEDMFGRPEVFGLMGVLAAAMNLAGSTSLTTKRLQADTHWLNHQGAFDAALEAATFILQTAHPDRKEYSMRFQPFLKSSLVYMGLAAADQTLDRIGTHRTEFIEGARSILERLSDRLRSESAK
jgi:hypothetical protein